MKLNKNQRTAIDILNKTYDIDIYQTENSIFGGFNGLDQFEIRDSYLLIYPHKKIKYDKNFLDNFDKYIGK